MESPSSQASLFDKLRSELACGVCLKTVVDPRLLSCPHTFCTTCLRSWYFACLKTALNEAIAGRRHPIVKYHEGVKDFPLRCPTCRVKTKVDPELECLGLSKNIALNNMVSLIRRQEYTDSEGNVLCDLCTTGSEVGLCDGCSLRLCPPCRTDFHRHIQDKNCGGMFLLKGTSADLRKSVVYIPDGARIPFLLSPKDAHKKLSRRVRKVKLRPAWVQVVMSRTRVSAKFDGVVGGAPISSRCREVMLMRELTTKDIHPDVKTSLCGELKGLVDKLCGHLPGVAGARSPLIDLSELAGRGQSADGVIAEAAHTDARPHNDGYVSDHGNHSDSGAAPARVNEVDEDRVPPITSQLRELRGEDPGPSDRAVLAAIRGSVKKQYQLDHATADSFEPAIQRSRHKIKKKLHIWIPVYVGSTSPQDVGDGAGAPAPSGPEYDVVVHGVTGRLYHHKASRHRGLSHMVTLFPPQILNLLPLLVVFLAIEIARFLT